ncbi:MAG TPA: MBL fold metallo-hydrolase [Acidobacteriota bacterium]|jgi:beta-lactamase superfamily II metal-dependent hydrolase
MRPNAELKLHFVNVNHGDCTIVEFPDHGAAHLAHLAVIDFGAKKAVDRGLARDYLRQLAELRRDGDPAFDFVIEFACVTHPHDDHYGGLTRFLDLFADPLDPVNNKIRAFWDCGFRTNAIDYNEGLSRVAQNAHIAFTRVGSGMEVELGGTRVTVLGPSVDLRNRFDTYGIGKNDASVVLKVKFGDAFAILAADAEYASWGKITEEFPRTQNINFFSDAIGLSERGETSDQLKCGLLKLSHHGSKHGSSLEYLERLKPRHVVIPAGSQPWYQANLSNWAGKFPHPLIRQTLQELDSTIDLRVTGETGNLIYKFTGNSSTPREVAVIAARPDDPAFPAELAARWP